MCGCGRKTSWTNLWERRLLDTCPALDLLLVPYFICVIVLALSMFLIMQSLQKPLFHFPQWMPTPKCFILRIAITNQGCLRRGTFVSLMQASIKTHHFLLLISPRHSEECLLCLFGLVPLRSHGIISHLRQKFSVLLPAVFWLHWSHIQRYSDNLWVCVAVVFKLCISTDGKLHLERSASRQCKVSLPTEWVSRASGRHDWSCMDFTPWQVLLGLITQTTVAQLTFKGSSAWSSEDLSWM